MARTRCTVRDTHRLIARQPRQPATFQEYEDDALQAHEASGASVERQRRAQDRWAAAAVEWFVAPAGFEALPRGAVLRIFELLPVDSRLRACGVARSWAAYLSRPEPWLMLDLSPGGGVARGAVSSALLRAAAARAGGALHTLDVSDCLWRLGLEGREETASDDCSSDTDSGADAQDEAGTPRRWLPQRVVLAVVAANAASLRVVRALCCTSPCDAPAAAGLRPPQLQLLLSAAPALKALHADVACTPAQAPTLLGGKGLYNPLRVRRLALCGIFRETDLPDAATADHVASSSLLALCGEHATLRSLELERVALDGDAAVEALAQAAPRLEGLCLRGGSYGTGNTDDLPLSHLAMLLHRQGSPLRALRFSVGDEMDAPATAEVLRAAPRLSELCLDGGWGAYNTADVAVALVAALTGHPTLRRLWLRCLSSACYPYETPPEEDEQVVVRSRPYVYALLGALLLDAPALQTLHASGSAFHASGADRERRAEAEAALLATLARGAVGAPALRSLELPGDGLRQLAPAAVRAAAPALQHLVLLRWHIDEEYYSPQSGVQPPDSTRGADARWVHDVDLLDDAAVGAWRQRAPWSDAFGDDDNEEDAVDETDG